MVPLTSEIHDFMSSLIANGKHAVAHPLKQKSELETGKEKESSFPMEEFL